MCVTVHKFDFHKINSLQYVDAFTAASKYLKPVVSCIYDKYVPSITDDYSTWVLKISYVITIGPQLYNKLCLVVKHLHSVIVIVTDQYVAFVIQGNAFRAIKLRNFGTCQKYRVFFLKYFL